jgi:hypothetical protein
MRTLLLTLFSFMLSATAFGNDSNRIIRLEQDVRDLERHISTLEREVRELRQQARRGGLGDLGEVPSEPAPTSDTWLSSTKWKALRVGMSEMEVIETLGQPTSMRVQEDSRVLLYAMEIGTSGFLGGSVTLKDRKVIEIEPPVLK